MLPVSPGAVLASICSSCLLFSVAAPVPAGAFELESASPGIVANGGEIVFAGSGLDEVTSVSLFTTFGEVLVPFSSASSSELRVTVPEDFRGGGLEYFALVESASGPAPSSLLQIVPSHVSLGPGESLDPRDSSAQIVLEPGAYLALDVGSFYPVGIYAGPGSVVEFVGDVQYAALFAAPGAVLDCSAAQSFGGQLLYSTGATVLGSLPASNGFPSTVIREIPPLSAVEGLGGFRTGVVVTLTVDGPGSVEGLPEGGVVLRGGPLTLTAVPDAGAEFAGWSGAHLSDDPVLDLSQVISDESITASFVDSSTIPMTRYFGDGGTVTVSPDREFYSEGETVVLTATPDAGYEFAAWGLDLAGGEAASVEVVVGGPMAVAAGFRPVGGPAPVGIESADLYDAPPGHPIELTGRGFSSVESVSLNHGPFLNPVEFTVLGETQLSLAMPELWRGSNDHHLVIEFEAGTAVQVPVGSAVVTDDLPPDIEDALEGVVVAAGGLLRLRPEVHVPGPVYVEAGGVVVVEDAQWPYTDFYFEDGSILDVRDVTVFYGRVFHSGGLTVLGTLPDPTPEGPSVATLPRIRGMRGIPSFGLGVPVEVEIVGDGTVMREPDAPFVREGQEFQLTAVPGPGSTFVAWGGALASSEPAVTIRAGINPLSVSATFAAGTPLRRFFGSGGTVVVDPDSGAFPAGSTVTMTATPDPGFEFIGWGLDAAGEAGDSIELTVEEAMDVSAGFRRSDLGPVVELASASPLAVEDGGVVSVVGSGFDAVTGVEFFGSTSTAVAPFTVLDDSAMNVEAVGFSQGSRWRYLVVETAGRTSVQVPTGHVEVREGDMPTVEQLLSPLVVKSGTQFEFNSSNFSDNVVYVEPGAMVRLTGSVGWPSVFAADGAVIDVSGLVEFTGRLVLSPGSVVLGDLPVPQPPYSEVRSVGSIFPAYGIGALGPGHRIAIEIEGPGSVSLDPPGPIFTEGESVTATAVPDEGAFFIRWLGVFGSRQPSISYRVGSGIPLAVRFSEEAEFFVRWQSAYFNAEEIADPVISGLSADPDGDQLTNAAEYAFGTDPRVANGRNGLTLKTGTRPSGRVFVTYRRPADAADVEYTVLYSTDMENWTPALRAGEGGGMAGEVEAVRETVTPVGDGAERVTVDLVVSGGLPQTMAFRLSAEIF